MRKSPLLILLFIMCQFGLMSQDCCDTDTKLVICYTSRFDHCMPATCDYTFDGVNMEGIRAKLNNPQNFGPLGISECDVETKRLGNVSSSQEITDLQCDIVIIGAFYITPADITDTTLPIELTDAIKEWSVECPENLTILSQGESTRWGYTIANQNVNPNSAGAVSTPNIFDGPFGSLTTFFQGGAFQANYNSIPPTGATILAEDGLGRPTIVLDNATNDILLADVGIICNGPGDVTTSPNVLNNNDILACNIFALGCEIAGIATFTEIDTIICKDDIYQLPDGSMVTDPGEYTVNLESITECDSIIVTTISLSDPEEGYIEYIGCDQDGQSITVGSTTYDQDNPSGVTIVQNQYGCDSLVNVDMIFNIHTSSTLDTLICEGDAFTYLGQSFDGISDTTLVIQNKLNCDSSIRVRVGFVQIEEIILDDQINILNNLDYTFENIIPTSYEVLWTPENGLSCTDCPNPTLSNQDNIETYALQITTPEGCTENLDLPINYRCRPYLPNIFNPNSTSGNQNFGALTPCILTHYSLSIFDRWGSLVFQSSDQSNMWNGKLNGDKIVPGVYSYLCSYSNDGIEEIKAGQITVIR